VIVHQACRFALDPTVAQRRALQSHCGAARFAFNWGLREVRRTLDARRIERQLLGGTLTEPLSWTLPALRREWNRAKVEVAPWWAENSKEAYSSGLDALARALQAWSLSRHGERLGEQVGFPRFRKRGHRDSCRFTTGPIRIHDHRHATLPRLGRLRSCEPTGGTARADRGGHRPHPERDGEPRGGPLVRLLHLRGGALGGGEERA
jgi:putative transposase